jgi:hypothetical protein
MDMVPGMYAGVPEYMYRAAGRSVLAAVVYLCERGVLKVDGDLDLDGAYHRS